MSNVQLFAVNTAGETVLLQLSEASPMKLNLSVASLDAFSPTSYYSQTFRIPGQGTNGKFFEDVYSVNGYSFDASKAAQAWINNEGFLFSIGNLNLNAVYLNERTDKIEYEVYFLGDTSDFSASVGSAYMNSIDTTDLNHELTYDNVVSSWGATAGATSGFKDGNVLYPLCEWGYTYDSNNFPTQNTLSIGFAKGATGLAGASFTLGPTAGLSLRQFKPAVRIKWLWDKIFSTAGYTYTSEFLESDLFDGLYMVSDSLAQPEQTELTALCKVSNNGRFSLNRGQTARIIYPTTISNPSLSFDIANSEFVTPVSGLYGFSTQGVAVSLGIQQAIIRVDLVSNLQGVLATYSAGTPSTSPFRLFWTLSLPSVVLTAGEKISVNMTCLAGSPSSVALFENIFQCTLAQPQVLVNSFLPPEGTLKNIDFIKGITKMFNLVFIPGRDQAKTFQIEPWVDWIRLGGTKDWTQFLDGSADTEQHAPFLEQPRIQQFTGLDDADFQNLSYQQQFKRNFMFHEFDSGINLVKGTKQTIIPFAPSPLQSIPFRPSTTPRPDWVFPTLAKLLPGDPTENKAGKVQPIQPKPRIFFYNGLQDNPVDWYLNTSLSPGATGQAQSKYPLVSNYQSFPPDTFTLDLTFQSKRPLWSPLSSYTGQTGVNLYTNYWSDYIDWIYDPYNRKKTVSMRLDPYDIETLRFNDRVWVQDSWYFVNKISDYPIGEVALVKVELIKVPDKAIPNIVNGASGPAQGECKSVAVCNNNSPYEPSETNTWTFVDCFNNLQTLTLEPETCASVCMLFPNASTLPPGWTAIPNGDCSGITPVISGEFIYVDFSVSGNEDLNATLLLEGATGGTAGTYIPMQYINLAGPSSLNGLFINVPYDYGFKTTLTWNNGVTGQSFVEGEFIIMQENTVTVASSSYSGFYAGPISSQLPTGVTAADYLITAFINGTGPTAHFWNLETDIWNLSTIIWNN
jgi:hypothetical protein